MDKLRMQSSNGVEDNITKIAQLFPDCVTETVDERSGQPKHLIDFEKLKQNLSDSVISERAERHSLPGPTKARRFYLPTLLSMPHFALAVKTALISTIPEPLY